MGRKRACVGVWDGKRREMGYLIQAFPFCHGVAEIFLVFRLFLFVIFRNSSFLVLLPHLQTNKGKSKKSEKRKLKGIKERALYLYTLYQMKNSHQHMSTNLCNLNSNLGPENQPVRRTLANLHQSFLCIPELTMN